MTTKQTITLRFKDGSTIIIADNLTGVSQAEAWIKAASQSTPLPQPKIEVVGVR